MEQKKTRIKDNTVDFLKKVPIYPNKVKPHFLGMRACNMPVDTLLVEDDEGFVFFISEEEKQKSIEVYISN